MNGDAMKSGSALVAFVGKESESEGRAGFGKLLCAGIINRRTARLYHAVLPGLFAIARPAGPRIAASRRIAE
jgi:hypothetical protein